MKPEFPEEVSSSVVYHSRYNYYVNRPEGIMSFNARTGIFALLPTSVGEILQKRGGEVASEIAEVDLKSLLDMGFLHYGDEQDQIISKFETIKNQNQILYLTLVPTLSCNFSCDYCFQAEYRDTQFMSAETQIAALNFVKGLISEGRRKVICTWFGGEPLLAKEIMLKMSVQIREIVQDSEANLISMDVITNGILLNGRVAKELADVGIESAQVSIDALTFYGSSKRGVIDKFGNPSIILRNIKEAREFLKIRIRINVSKHNASEVKEITAVLDENGFKGSYHLAHIHDHEEESSFITDSSGKRSPDCSTKACSSCNSASPEESFESASLSRPIYAQIEQESFLSRKDAFQQIVNKLQPKAHPCSATSGQMFVIDPAGYISRCWHSAGSPSEAMGNVHNSLNSVESSEVARRWHSFSPLAYEACKTCKVLPLCMGGCSHPRIFMEATTPPCESIKKQIQFCVDTVGKMLEVTPEQQEIVSK
jgi:uncharacterized protein